MDTVEALNEFFKQALELSCCEESFFQDIVAQLTSSDTDYEFKIIIIEMIGTLVQNNPKIITNHLVENIFEELNYTVRSSCDTGYVIFLVQLIGFIVSTRNDLVTDEKYLTVLDNLLDILDELVDSEAAVVRLETVVFVLSQVIVKNYSPINKLLKAIYSVFAAMILYELSSKIANLLPPLKSMLIFAREQFSSNTLELDNEEAKVILIDIYKEFYPIIENEEPVLPSNGIVLSTGDILQRLIAVLEQYKFGNMGLENMPVEKIIAILQDNNSCAGTGLRAIKSVESLVKKDISIARNIVSILGNFEDLSSKNRILSLKLVQLWVSIIHYHPYYFTNEVLIYFIDILESKSMHEVKYAVLTELIFLDTKKNLENSIFLELRVCSIIESKNYRSSAVRKKLIILLRIMMKKKIKREEDENLFSELENLSHENTFRASIQKSVVAQSLIERSSGKLQSAPLQKLNLLTECLSIMLIDVDVIPVDKVIAIKSVLGFFRYNKIMQPDRYLAKALLELSDILFSRGFCKTKKLRGFTGEKILNIMK